MSRVVINPSDLAGTAALLEEAAGEYQAIGTRVASCDCGCMPPNVALIVEAATSQLRMQANALSGEVSREASDLAWRAGVSHDGAAPTYATVGLGTDGGGSSISIGPLAGLGTVAAPSFLTIPSSYGAGAPVQPGTISIGSVASIGAPAASGFLSIGNTAPQATYSGALSIAPVASYGHASSGGISISSGAPSSWVGSPTVAINPSLIQSGFGQGDGYAIALAADYYRNSALYRDQLGFSR